MNSNFICAARIDSEKSSIEERCASKRFSHALLQRSSIVGVAPRLAHIARACVVRDLDVPIALQRGACVKQPHAF